MPDTILAERSLGSYGGRVEASDADSVRARLRAAPTDPRERDVLCEAISAELVAAEAEPPFDIASTDLDSDAFFICADRYWRRRFLAARTALEVAR